MSIEQRSPVLARPMPGATVLAFPMTRRTGPVQAWLWSVAATIFLMVLVGGATRLTESGLSITEWEPLFGALPPLSAAAWEAKFAAYRAIPQFALHPDMTLGDFKTIFFWEWSHRLIGRALGLVIAAPLAWFWWRGRLTSRLKRQAIGLLALVGLQGAVGWWMVKSGLVDRTEVSQYRLATHLLLATVTLGYTIWLAQGLSRRPVEQLGGATRRLRSGATLIVALVLGQIGLGALVAGLRAGYLDNTWPLIEGGLVPPVHSLLFLQPAWRNLFENATTVQFDHRMLAYVLFAVALAYGLAARRIAPGTRAARRALSLAGLVLCQAAIGIVTLVWVVPFAAALAHQAFAMVVFGMAVVHRRALSRPAEAAPRR
ncbi:COX15/CtaA family protein [Lichenihabitans sp. Uapishka_5]|uniref:COX15/CtaA family protein n=1 Tax=Lichenihabitans sp. Uapishka_5 TaxID=3037302 RepID=UPI0029E7FEAD|nr:COX15/CtaA family protein [Lichenihabitans sp. Uapishka_5]MDX7951991.1 COX15/CtaA family protein [Lichenihabitans sp. Uapishka_5]